MKADRLNLLSRGISLFAFSWMEKEGKYPSQMLPPHPKNFPISIVFSHKILQLPHLIYVKKVCK